MSLLNKENRDYTKHALAVGMKLLEVLQEVEGMIDRSEEEPERGEWEELAKAIQKVLFGDIPKKEPIIIKEHCLTAKISEKTRRALCGEKEIISINKDNVLEVIKPFIFSNMNRYIKDIAPPTKCRLEVDVPNGFSVSMRFKDWVSLYYLYEHLRK
jgi:hypothetical protein